MNSCCFEFDAFDLIAVLHVFYVSNNFLQKPAITLIRRIKPGTVLFVIHVTSIGYISSLSGVQTAV